MPRTPRLRSKTNIYHVTFRGNNKEYVLKTPDQKHMLLNLIREMKKKYDISILGYCIMSNHAHLIIREGKGILGKIIGKIESDYAKWYNRLNSKENHVFGNRYGSEPVEDDKYLLSVLVYILLNPVNAKIVDAPEKYCWSSYREIVNPKRSGIIDASYLQSLIKLDSLIAFIKSRTLIAEHLDV